MCEESLEEFMKQRELENKMTKLLIQIENTEVEEEITKLYQLIRYITK